MDSLRAAAARVDITPPVGTPAPLGPQDEGISQINGRIYGAVLLLRHGRRGFAWLSLNQCFITAEFEKTISRPVAEVLGISENNVLISCTRNLASPLPFGDKTQNGTASPRLAYHDQMIDRLIVAARQVAKRLAPVTMRYAEGSLPELQYNRKGHRPDGTTFFMREADRLANPDWIGLIDPRIPVLRLDGPGGRPVAVVTQYTGDPCIATQLERPVVSPDLPGYAAECLAEQLGEPELPVLYFQGCKGDIAVKYMFAGEDKAREAGRRLGAMMGRLAEEAQTTSAEPLCSARGTAVVPLEDLPSLEHLEKEKVELAAGGISIHHVRALHGSLPNRSPKPRRLLLFQYCAEDAWPLLGSDWDAFCGVFLRGEPCNQPRVTEVPVRLAMPSSLKVGSIYETQTILRKSTFKHASVAR